MPLNDETININEVSVSDRIRIDMQDIEGLARSIKEFGIIQPIVLSPSGDGAALRATLVAGGRRLTALKKLNIVQLRHGREFIWRGEESAYDRKAVELEENLRRSDLHWSEVCAAKASLLALMQEKHGVAGAGRPSRASQQGSAPFGVRKLAEMLGESHATTSKDLQMAELVSQFPVLAKLPTKNDALRRMNVATTVVGMQATAKAIAAAQPAGTAPPKAWQLYEGNYLNNSSNVADSSVDLVITDLPYNIGLGDSTASHAAGLSGFVDSFASVSDMCRDVAIESWRVLKDNRFAVFFFGFNFYRELYDNLTSVGFTVDDYPFIWIRDRTAPPNAFARYAKTYDPALICSKGNPTFIRSGSGNSVAIPSVRGTDRLHAAQKPVAIMERFVLDMTAEDATVVDWMAGSGSTGVAAVKNKRKAILFELEKPSCEIIKARLGKL